MNFFSNLMNYSKIYELLLSAHSFFPYYFGNGKALPPARIQLELTYRCNLRCPMCYQDKLYKKGEEELTTQEWIDVIKQLPRFCLITLIGGESMVRPDFKKIAQVALSSHPCNLVTNGVLLAPDMINFLVDKRLFLLGLSLDGVDSIHDQMRGVSGTYKRVIENIKELQDQKKQKGKKFPLLDVKTVVTKTNLENLWDLFKVTQELRADFFTISLPKVSEDQFNPKLKEKINEFAPFDFSLLDEIHFPRLKKILKKISSTASKTKIRFYPQFSSIEKLDRSLYNLELINKNFLPCRQPWSGAQVGATGFVYPCLSLNLGSVRKESFGKIWNGREFRNFRKALKKSKLFPSCLGCCYLKQR